MSTGAAQTVLREATAADAAAVLRLEHELFGVDAWPPALVTEALAGARRAAVVAVADGEVTGYAVARVAGDVADLERLAVAPASRRAGLATALLREVGHRVATEGAQRLLLEVAEGNAGARAFYAAHGSVELDRRRRYYRDGSDALVLALPLSGREGENGG